MQSGARRAFPWTTLKATLVLNFVWAVIGGLLCPFPSVLLVCAAAQFMAGLLFLTGEDKGPFLRHARNWILAVIGPAMAGTVLWSVLRMRIAVVVFGHVVEPLGVVMTLKGMAAM